MFASERENLWGRAGASVREGRVCIAKFMSVDERACAHVSVFFLLPCVYSRVVLSTPGVRVCVWCSFCRRSVCASE